VSDVLESFDAPEQKHIATFQSDELTALCPFDFGGPDHYSMVVRYEPDGAALESRSLKRWVEAQRDREATAEICLKPETKRLIKERKKNGETYDLWLRRVALGVED